MRGVEDKGEHDAANLGENADGAEQRAEKNNDQENDEKLNDLRHEWESPLDAAELAEQNADGTSVRIGRCAWNCEGLLAAGARKTLARLFERCGNALQATRAVKVNFHYGITRASPNV